MLGLISQTGRSALRRNDDAYPRAECKSKRRQQRPLGVEVTFEEAISEKHGLI